MDVDQLRRVIASRRKQPEGATGLHCLELRPVPDQQHLRAGFGGVSGDPVERERPSESGLVDDDELPR